MENKEIKAKVWCPKKHKYIIKTWPEALKDLMDQFGLSYGKLI